MNSLFSAWFLRLAYVMFVVLGVAFSTKTLACFIFTLPASVLTIPILAFIFSMIYFLYGLRYVINTMVLSILLLIAFVSYGYLITHLPAPDYAINNRIFNPLLQETSLVFRNNLLLFLAFPLIMLALFALNKNSNLLISCQQYLQKRWLPNKTENISKTGKFLGFFILVYTATIISASWYDPRLLQLAWFTVGSGALTFPITSILLDIITEVYGYKQARLAIWCGFLFSLLVLLYAQIVLHWHSDDSNNFIAYQHFLIFNFRVIIASFVSYFATETVSAYLIARLKILCTGQLMPLRFISSSMLAYFLDAFIFCLIAFFGTMRFSDFIHFTFTSWLFMMLIEILFLPCSVYLAKKLKILEMLDIYDQGTKFTLFSFDHNYRQEQNKFSLNKTKLPLKSTPILE